MRWVIVEGWDDGNESGRRGWEGWDDVGDEWEERVGWWRWVGGEGGVMEWVVGEGVAWWRWVGGEEEKGRMVEMSGRRGGKG
jgi:hypothetical protein